MSATSEASFLLKAMPRRRSLPRSGDLGKHAGLLEQFHHGDLGPVLCDLTVLRAVNMDFAPLDPLVCGRRSHERTLVGGGGGAPLHDLVTRGDEILFGHNHIRKSAVHHDADLPEAFE